jgi:hypothetical protein
MRRAIAAGASAAVLAAPALLAFRSGGFFDQPRLIAGVGACILLMAAALAAERPLPRSWPGRLALGGLAALAGWTALSVSWAPIGGAAIDDAQRLVLYALFFAAAAAWLRGRATAAVEPALALGALVVVGYGLSERLLPGLLEFKHSVAAGGRLEQPITYWNAMGAVAVTGLVLCVRLAGDRTRARWLRAAGAGAVAPLAAGLYLTLSRGALAALAAGMLALMLVTRDRGQARAIAVAAAAGALAAGCAAALPELGAAHPGGGAAGQGALMLGVLVVLAAAAAGVELALSRREGSGRLAPGRVSARLLGPVAVVLALGLAGAALVAAGSGGDGQRAPASGPGAARLRSLQSNRYDYWGVALRAFGNHPLKGVGTAGFRVEWERERDVAETTQDAHSIYIETAAELGLVGLLALGALLAGVGVSAARARARAPAAAAGAIAALVAWAFHAGFDWDWEMPAVTLPALALAGLVIALGDREPGAGTAARSPRQQAPPA